MKYKKVKRKNPAKPADAPKYYAQPVWDGIVTTEDLIDGISGRSSLTKGDVLNVIENFLDEIPRYLRMGKAVKINKFCVVRASFSSQGIEDPTKFHASHICNEKIVFLPAVELKQAIVGKLSYECIDPKEATPPAGGGSEGGGDDVLS